MAGFSDSRPNRSTDTDVRRWRWFRFSPRALIGLLILLIVAFAIPIFGFRAYRQSLAIRHLRDLGATVLPETRWFRPDWLRDWIGESHFESISTVRYLNLSDIKLTDADVACLKDLSGLEWLALNRTALTDGGMRHLGQIPTLLALRVEQTRVTDHGLVHLEPLKQLKVLSLKRTHVTGRMLESLKALPRLHFLDVEGTSIDESAIAELRAMPGLTELRLPAPRFR